MFNVATKYCDMKSHQGKKFFLQEFEIKYSEFFKANFLKN